MCCSQLLPHFVFRFADFLSVPNLWKHRLKHSYNQHLSDDTFAFLDFLFNPFYRLRYGSFSCLTFIDIGKIISVGLPGEEIFTDLGITVVNFGFQEKVGATSICQSPP